MHCSLKSRTNNAVWVAINLNSDAVFKVVAGHLPGPHDEGSPRLREGAAEVVQLMAQHEAPHALQLILLGFQHASRQQQSAQTGD